MRTVLQGTNLFLLMLLTAFVGLSSCQRAHYALYAPTPDHSVRPAVGAALTPTLAPTTLASADLTPDFPVESIVATPVATETVPTVVPVEPAIPTVVRRLSAWQKYKLLLRNPTAPGCDQLVLRNGDVVDAKIKEVGLNEIKYKKCTLPNGPDYTVAKRDVLSIRYANGETERFNTVSTNSPSQSSSSSNRSYSSPTNPQDDGLRTDPFAIVAIAAGAIAFFVTPYLFGVGAVVFGALSLSRISKEPGRFKGKGLAIAGMVVGILAVLLILAASR